MWDLSEGARLGRINYLGLMPRSVVTENTTNSDPVVVFRLVRARKGIEEISCRELIIYGIVRFTF